MLWGGKKKTEKQIGIQLQSKHTVAERLPHSIFKKISLGTSLVEAPGKTQWSPPVSFVPISFSNPSPLGQTRISNPPVALWLREPTSLPSQPPCQSDSPCIFPQRLFLDIPWGHLLVAPHPLRIQSRRHWNLCRPAEAELFARRVYTYKYPQKS